LSEKIREPYELATRQRSLFVVRGVVKELPRESLRIHAEDTIIITSSEELITTAPEFDGADI
jgi:hypothetical protein